MRKKNLLDHPANTFEQTILSVGGKSLRELHQRAGAVPPAGCSEQLINFKIRLATSDGQKRLARMLVQKMVATRGYETGGVAPAESLETPNQLTLVVSDTKERPRGTMSMIFDTSAYLPADLLFHDLLSPLRAQGRRLIEISRLAIDRSGGSKRLFAAMAHIFLIYATVVHRYTDWIIEANPRHVGFYEKLIGMQAMSEVRQGPAGAAPAVLLRIALADMLERAEALGGRGTASAADDASLGDHVTEGLYPYFLSQDDARAIARRLLSDQGP
jgi:hypothetical protein